MKTLITIGAICIVSCFLSAACKKSKDPVPPEPVNRIREIAGPNESKIFMYDNEHRLTRINSTAGYSTRFTYLSSEIIVQDYSSNDQPDPQSKYRFTIANGRITSGRKYLPSGAIVHEYVYQYDNDQRLARVAFSIKDFTGNDAENHLYQLYYDAQNNLQQIAYKRSAVGQQSDSTSITFTWFTGKSYITWKNMGFDYFGKAAVGHKLSGQVPIPFSLMELIYPAQQAAKTVDTKNYRWNPGTGTWVFHSGSNNTYLETSYQYNELGWLTKHKDYYFHWDD